MKSCHGVGDLGASLSSQELKINGLCFRIMLLTLNAFLINCVHGIASEGYTAQCCDMGEKEKPNLFSVGLDNFL